MPFLIFFLILPYFSLLGFQDPISRLSIILNMVNLCIRVLLIALRRFLILYLLLIRLQEYPLDYPLDTPEEPWFLLLLFSIFLLEFFPELPLFLLPLFIIFLSGVYWEIPENENTYFSNLFKRGLGLALGLLSVLIRFGFFLILTLGGPGITWCNPVIGIGIILLLHLILYFIWGISKLNTWAKQNPWLFYGFGSLFFSILSFFIIFVYREAYIELGHFRYMVTLIFLLYRIQILSGWQNIFKGLSPFSGFYYPRFILKGGMLMPYIDCSLSTHISIAIIFFGCFIGIWKTLTGCFSGGGVTGPVPGPVPKPTPDFLNYWRPIDKIEYLSLFADHSKQDPHYYFWSWAEKEEKGWGGNDFARLFKAYIKFNPMGHKDFTQQHNFIIEWYCNDLVKAFPERMHIARLKLTRPLQRQELRSHNEILVEGSRDSKHQWNTELPHRDTRCIPVGYANYADWFD